MVQTQGISPQEEALAKGLDVEDFDELILLIVLSIFVFLNFSTQVDFKSDEWQWYYYDALKKVVAAMQKCDFPRKTVGLTIRNKLPFS